MKKLNEILEKHELEEVRSPYDIQELKADLEQWAKEIYESGYNAGLIRADFTSSPKPISNKDTENSWQKNKEKFL